MDNLGRTNVGNQPSADLSDTQTMLYSSILAGCAAGIFQTSISQPFEVVKTGLQLRRSLPGTPPFELYHKLKFYFCGCSALNAGLVLKTFTRFTTFEKICLMLKDPNSQNIPLQGPRLLLAGAITGFMESLWVVPFESIKTTMIENSILVAKKAHLGKGYSEVSPISQSSLKKGLKPTFHKPVIGLTYRERIFWEYEKNPSTRFFSVAKEMYLTRGLRSFVQGFSPTIFRQMGNSVVRFTAYIWLRQLISPNKNMSEYHAAAAGALSSAAVVAITQPVDVVKTRMQSKYAWSSYKNSINCAYRMFAEEGARSLWKGWLPRLFKVSISGGISFGVYQYFENLFKLLENERMAS